MGLDNLRIRLTGWANGGLDYTVFNRTKPLGILGGSKGLEAMAQALQEDGIEVYPGADISWVRREGMLDGFSLSRNAAHQLDNTYARVYPYNLGSSLGQYDRPRYAVNSRSMLTFADGMLRDFPAFLGGIALEGMGEVINSDSDAGAGSRTDSMNDYTAIAEKAGQKRRLMFTGGNAYVWAYADEIAGRRPIRAATAPPAIRCRSCRWCCTAASPIPARAQYGLRIRSRHAQGQSKTARGCPMCWFGRIRFIFPCRTIPPIIRRLRLWKTGRQRITRCWRRCSVIQLGNR